jgi:hypothetical protein
MPYLGDLKTLLFMASSVFATTKHDLKHINSTFKIENCKRTDQPPLVSKAFNWLKKS